MYLSLDWINEYVNIADLDPTDIAEKLTLHCAEVEGFEHIGSGIRDTVIEIDNKSLTHRPDLWGHYGFAREIAAIFHRSLADLPVVDVEEYHRLPVYPVSIEDEENCSVYHCMELDADPNRQSPSWLQARLAAVGQRSINLVVDLTNYVMHDIGQPTHVFGAGNIRSLTVKALKSPCAFVTLDGIERKMIPGDLMILSHHEPVAIAGIIGGAESEVEGETRHMLLESASFKGSRVRRTASRLGLRTEAAARFEKNQPATNARLAIRRFVRLLSLCDPSFSVISQLSTAAGHKQISPEIQIPYEFIEAKIGIEISKPRILEILDSLGFYADFREDTLVTNRPSHRGSRDISIGEDIIEEIARIYGYDRIEPILPHIKAEPGRINRKLRREHTIQKLLAAAHGYSEVRSYSWFDSHWLDEIGYRPERALELENPSAAHCRWMRTNIITNLLRAAQDNTPRRESFCLFEIGKVFHSVGDSDHAEYTHLAAVDVQMLSSGNAESHFLGLKRSITDILRGCGIKGWVFSQTDEIIDPWESAGQTSIISIDAQEIGRAGIVASQITSLMRGRVRIAWFEINLDTVPLREVGNATFVPISPYQPSFQDVSILFPADKTFAELMSVLDQFSHPRIISREFLYRYSGEHAPKGTASYTFRYKLGSQVESLFRGDIDDFLRLFMLYLESQNLSLRK